MGVGTGLVQREVVDSGFVMPIVLVLPARMHKVAFCEIMRYRPRAIDPR